MDRRAAISKGLKYSFAIGAFASSPLVMLGLSRTLDTQASLEVGNVDLINSRAKSSLTGVEVIGGATIIDDSDWHTGIKELRAALMYRVDQGQNYKSVVLPVGVAPEVVSMVDLNSDQYPTPEMLVHFGRTSGSTRYSHFNTEFGVLDTQTGILRPVYSNRVYEVGRIDSIDINDGSLVTIHGKSVDMPQDTRSYLRILGDLDIQIDRLNRLVVGATYTPAPITP